MSSSPMLVELPENVREQLAAHKLINVDFENRTHNRVSAYCEGVLRINSQPRVLRESAEYSPVICAGAVVKDISRKGIGFYYHEQLYPLQTLNIEFQGRVISAMVVRCRFLNKNCYEVGAVVESVESHRK